METLIPDSHLGIMPSWHNRHVRLKVHFKKLKVAIETIKEIDVNMSHNIVSSLLTSIRTIMDHPMEKFNSSL